MISTCSLSLLFSIATLPLLGSALHLGPIDKGSDPSHPPMAVFFTRTYAASCTYAAYGPGFRADFGRRSVHIHSPAGRVEIQFPGATSDKPSEDARVRRFDCNRDERVKQRVFTGIRYRNLFPGIDLVYRESGSHLKSEFIVAPGADADLIRIAYVGARGIAVSESGALVVHLSNGELYDSGLVGQQWAGNKLRHIPIKFRITENGQVGFEIGAYDRSKPLVIDPVVSFSTYLGGNRFDSASAVAVDLAGNIYVAGWTESGDLPVMAPVQERYHGGVDAFVAKFNRTASLVYCTYLGGGGDDRVSTIAVDATGSIYVAGSTTSTDFPVTQSAYQTRLAGWRNGFITKLNPAGDKIEYSTYLGGSGADSVRGIAVAQTGEAYIVGETTSPNFPVVDGLYQSLRGRQDAFIAGLNTTGTAVIFSTYIGGYGDDTAAGIAVDKAEGIYVTGATTSPDFPTIAATQPNIGGGQDAFVLKLVPASRKLAYSTFLGGKGGNAALPEAGMGIDIDPLGNAYVVGLTASPDFPLRKAVQPMLHGPQDAFVAKFSPAGDALLYSTYLGGSSLDIGTAIKVDASGNACVTGYTASSNFPVNDPLNPTFEGLYDVFVTCLPSAGDRLLLSTVVGGSASDAGYGIALLGASIYIAGVSTSNDVPLKNPVQVSNGGSYGVLLMELLFSEAPHGLEFFPVTPCRIADTREFGGKTGSFGPPAILSRTTREFNIPGSSCGIPNSAVAYSLNVTAVPHGYLGWLTVFPTGQAQPVVSTLNALDGYITANAAIVPAGTAGYISVFASDTTDVLVDINGYFAPPDPGGLQFYPVVPCRVADTRSFGGMTGSFGPPSLHANSTREIPVLQNSCGIPPAATAYSVNITAQPPGYLGWLTVWPTGQAQPVASTLNSWDGEITANAAIVPAGSGGSISICTSNESDVFLDINGYFAPPSTGLYFYPITPCRIADTRSFAGMQGAFGPPAIPGGSSRIFPVVVSSCGIPSTAVAYSLNVTAQPRQHLGWLTVWPAGQPQPVTSTLNSWKGTIVANAAVVPAGVDGSISVYASDTTDVFIDINGYMAP